MEAGIQKAFLTLLLMLLISTATTKLRSALADAVVSIIVVAVNIYILLQNGQTTKN